MSETKPTMDTASDLPPEPQGLPAFLGVTGDAMSLLANPKGRAKVVLDPDPDTTEVMHLRVAAATYDGQATLSVRVIIPAGRFARKLRRLATYRRDQQRIPAEMDVQDELRAMEVLAKTLDSLNLPTRERVLHWLDHRKCMQVTAHTLGREPLPTLVSVSESLRIAKDRVLGQEPPA